MSLNSAMYRSRVHLYLHLAPSIICEAQSSIDPASPSRSLSSTATETIRHQRPIYVAATKQHVGKTSVSLALVSHFTKRFGPENVGYMKAVGQQCLRVWEENEGDETSEEKGHYVTIDKDVKLIRDHFRLKHLKFADMSPVLIPRGYTKSYLDGEIDHQSQMADIRRAYLNIVRSTSEYDQMGVRSNNSITICEGTGHAGVGSVVGAGNARVAAELGADVVLVANGGLGKAYDELELNRSLCLVSCTKSAPQLCTFIVTSLISDFTCAAIWSQHCWSYY
jgi:dethiobiotin synthetase